ncbi:exonuclease 1 [Nesidiocoris tenuis]|uniref:Exonuclease 1 n=1 Tax=Nesidiocoris tenuis TaxID=355587 RepID=A0ABN7APG0_9HEMI|nr:exonuclease 1 [Nesidiocoris tenuis]
MGITGLIPFLKAASRPVNVREYSGCTVAVDAYCWLHKGAIACAEKLVRGDETDVYVNYCVKYIDMLLSHNVKPILVFDGRHLPAKAETEKFRRERRNNNKRKAADLLRQDRPDEARNVMKACIDITPEMAYSLIKRCREMCVDCIVAPYEADAQLAYLNLAGFAHIVITEDSDLLLFGCERVLFKLDLVGNGLLIEQSKLHLAMKVHPDKFSMDKFRHMCILSGCDYLNSLPGIGLSKACKFIKRTAETNISRALTKMGAHLNMANLVVSPEYREKFLVADSMFKHQPVFDPTTRKVIPMTPLSEGEQGPGLEQLPADISYQLALGNLDPFTLEKFDDWDPDCNKMTSLRTNGWNKVGRTADSIWSRTFTKPSPILPLDRRKPEKPTVTVRQTSDCDEYKFPKKKRPEEELQDLRERFGIKSPPSKKSRSDETCDSGISSQVIECSDPEDDPLDITNAEEDFLEELCDEKLSTLDDLIPSSAAEETKPSIRNKFSCQKKTERSGSTSGLEGLRNLRTIQIDEDNVVCSRFFSSSQDSNCENRPITPSTMDLNNCSSAEQELNNELELIVNGGDRRPADGAASPSKSIFASPKRQNTSHEVSDPAVSPLAEISQLDKNLKLGKDERPSLLARLDKVSQILSDKVKTPASSFKWDKKTPNLAQKTFSSYLSPPSGGSAVKNQPPVKPLVSKSAKPSGLFKSKKSPAPVKTNLLEKYGFKSKPKMSL